jgi:hypothetical protein
VAGVGSDGFELVAQPRGTFVLLGLDRLVELTADGLDALGTLGEFVESWFLLSGRAARRLTHVLGEPFMSAFEKTNELGFEGGVAGGAAEQAELLELGERGLAVGAGGCGALCGGGARGCLGSRRLGWRLTGADVDDLGDKGRAGGSEVELAGARLTDVAFVLHTVDDGELVDGRFVDMTLVALHRWMRVYAKNAEGWLK